MTAMLSEVVGWLSGVRHKPKVTTMSELVLLPVHTVLCMPDSKITL